jgi:hypothetical protein
MVFDAPDEIKAGWCERGTQQIALHDLYVRRIIAVRCGRVRLRKVNAHRPSGRFDRLCKPWQRLARPASRVAYPHSRRQSQIPNETAQFGLRKRVE